MSASKDPSSEHCVLKSYSRNGKQLSVIANDGYKPAVSPDGKLLAFVRKNQILVQAITPSYQTQGSARPVATEESFFYGPVWIAGGKELLYAMRDRNPLRRVAIAIGAKPQIVNGIDNQTELFSLEATSTGEVTAEVYRHDAALWRMDLRARAPHFEKLQTIPHADSRHRVSPDGRRVVFVSRGALWTSDLNGSNARLVANHSELILNPRFSPDGRSIAFSGNPAKSNADLRSRLYVVAVDGGIPRRLLPKLDDVSFRNWSRDGKWLYVSREDVSLQSDTKPQLWRVNVASGELAQITKNGGIAAEESADEGSLFYTTPYYPKLYRVPISGGMETQLMKTGLNAVFGGAFAVARGSIFFVPDVRGEAKAPVMSFDLISGEVDQIAATDFSPLTLQLSPDERYLFATSDPPAKQVRVIIDGLR